MYSSCKTNKISILIIIYFVKINSTFCITDRKINYKISLGRGLNIVSKQNCSILFISNNLILNSNLIFFTVTY